MSRHQEIFKLVEGLIQDNKGSDYEVSLDLDLRKEIGRASCRERVCLYV